MSLLFLIFITLSPFSPLFFRGVDLWYGAGQYFQTGLVILLAYSLFEKQKEINIKNLPLSLLTAYLGLLTCFIWYQTLKTGQLNFIVFGPFFNFLCFLIFYKLSFQLNRENIYKIIRFLSYAVCAYLFFCVLQFFDLDPFFKMAHMADKPLHRTVGLMGNETQNASYLAICLPVFYLQRNRFSTLCACFVWAVIGITGSASAIITALVVTIFFSVFHRLSKIYYAFIILGAISFVLLKGVEFSSYFNPWGRLDIWGKMWPLIKQRPIFGSGFGSMNVLSRQIRFEGWRHAHNEYYQMFFEVGIIGLMGVLYCIWEYFRNILKDRLGITLASLFLGFCIASLLYFPSHLWLPCTIGMLSYSFMFVLKNQEDSYVIHIGGD
jgi:O-antigen ligase